MIEFKEGIIFLFKTIRRAYDRYGGKYIVAIKNSFPEEVGQGVGVGGDIKQITTPNHDSTIIVSIFSQKQEDCIRRDHFIVFCLSLEGKGQNATD